MQSFLEALSRDAGELALEYRARLHHLNVDRKSPKDLVTEADIAVESFIVKQIRDRYPDHGIFGEESGNHEADSEYRWLIDPIDGTAAFVHEQPFFSVSIAVERHGRLELGAVNAPVLGELFLAARGAGAWCNGRLLQVSNQGSLEDSILATGFACIRAGLPRNNLPYFNAFMPRIRDIRRYGSAAIDLCFVAAGRLEGFWELNLKPYDVCAGLLMVEEAGGHWSDFSGGRADLYAEVLASNGHVHDAMMTVLAGCG